MGYNRTVRLMLWLALITAEVLMAAGWLLDFGEEHFEGLADVLAWLANLPALVGLPLLVLMVTLGSRTPQVERQFGLDRMMQLHTRLGPVVIGLFVIHGGLKILAHGLHQPGGFELAMIWQLYLTPLSGLGVSLAKIALALLLFGVGLVKIGRKLLPFNFWKPLHLSAYLVVLLGLTHAQLTANIIAEMPLDIVWLGLAAVFILVLTWRSKYLKGRTADHTALLEQTLELAPDIHGHFLTDADGAAPLAQRRAGQFAVLRLKGLFLWGEPHPFTVSSAPAQNRLGFSIRQGGRFTRRLARLKPGQRVLCEGPYGIFTPDLTSKHELIMIAGGIGVTPFLSVIRQAAAQNSPTPLTLIWSTKTREEAFAAPELAELAARGRLKMVHVFSRENKTDGGTGAVNGVAVEYGRLDQAMLQNHLNPNHAQWWLCGPPAMQKAVLSLLDQVFEVKPGQVHRERFLW